MSASVAFIGPGRAGLALGHALWQSDAVSDLVYYGRRPEPPSHPLFNQGVARYVFGIERPAPGTAAVFLSVPDGILHSMAETLAAHGEAPPGCAALHLSGALTTDVLGPLHARGYSVGSIHPLQAITNPLAAAERLPRSWFAVSGEPRALGFARSLIRSMGARDILVPATQRPLYHAAAVLAADAIPVALSLAQRLLNRLGVPDEEARPALVELARGVVDGYAEGGGGHAATGPVARGDLESVRLHLRSLDGPERKLYAALARAVLGLADPGPDDVVRAEISELIGREA